MAKRRSRGDGSIYYDEKRKKFIGQISTGTDEKGKRKRKTVYGDTKKEVKEKLKAIEFQIFSGTFTEDSGITIRHLAEQMLEDKLNQNEIKPGTYLRNTETLKKLAPIYDTPLQAATETQLRDYLTSLLSYSQSTLGKIYNTLTRTFKEAARRKIISENPMEYIKKPRSKKDVSRVRAFTKDEQRRFISALTDNDVNYKEQMLLSLAVGMRMGEINALHVEDVDFRFNVIRINKTVSKGKDGECIIGDSAKTDAGTRTITMTSSVRSLLSECIGNKKSGLIFTRNNKLITTGQVYNQFCRTLAKYNILDPTVTDGRIDLHSLRHTYGTRCAEAGMPPKVLQEIMGHTDISITMNTYFYATKDYVTENVRRIDAIMEAEGLTVFPSDSTEKNLKKDA